MKCFINFIQSAVNAREEEDENPISSVVAENEVTNNSYGYQNVDRTLHTITKYLNDGKTHGVINQKIFKRFLNDQLRLVELVKSEMK